MTRWRKTLEIVTNVAILAVCCLIGWSYFTHKHLSFGAQAAIGEQEIRLQGQSLPNLPGYRWGSHQKTLVLAIRKGCHFCEASLPFYKQLGDLEKSNSFHAHVLAVMPDEKNAGAGVLQSSGAAIDGVFDQPLDAIKVSGTPTLLLLDADGRVEHAWVGQLSAEREKEVIVAAEK